MTKLQNIERLFTVINKSVFRIDGSLDYDRVTDATIRLANLVHEFPLSDDGHELWDIGEFSECCLSDYIVGAYWHFAEWHGGQWSKGYAALSALGRVFSPGMTDIESEKDSPAYDAYMQLGEIAQAA